MTDKHSEQQFVSRIREALDQSAEQLAPGVRSRLSRMRHEAAALHAERQAPRKSWRWAAGLAAASVVAVLMLMLPFNRPAEKTPLAVIDDMEILASSDPLEIYEDMEFYSWLSDLENDVQNS